MDRRPIKARDTKWAATAARRLTALGVSPNQISVMSLGFAAVAGFALLAVPRVDIQWGQSLLYLAAVACIQLRLLCNLLDGMVAVEGGLGSKTGELFNEFPDRLSDILILLGSGYAAGEYGPSLGCAAALLAVLTAYVRTLGGAAGVTQPFCGPMAKQQRMVVVCLACVLCAIGGFLFETRWIMPGALGVIALGSAATAIRRLRIIAAEMRSR